MLLKLKLFKNKQSLLRFLNNPSSNPFIGSRLLNLRILSDMRLNFQNTFWPISFVALLFSLVLLESCATVIAPEGGPEDETPPQMDSLRSTPNFQTNFTKQRIELKFDEWVKLNDVFNQIVVSPPMDPSNYEVSLKGKTVRFDFKEEAILRENATYTINFGDAIQDLTQGNKTSDLKFVFSTGDVIDSLEVKGTIRDAYTGEAIEDALFMMYENLNDTVVRTIKPLYFARTNALGQFTITNVRADTFKGFALVDSDVNYLYNQPSEKIGFPDNLIVVADDSTSKPIKIKVFQESIRLKIKEKFIPDYGKVSFHFNTNPKDVELTYSQLEQKTYQRMEGDSIQLWYNLDSMRSWNIFLNQDTFLNDTIKVRSRKKADFLEENPLTIGKPRRSSRKGRAGNKKKEDDQPKVKQVLSSQKINPAKQLVLTFNHPLDSFDVSKIQLLQDTSKQVVKPQFQIDSTDRRNLQVDFKWKEKIPYQLDFLPGAVTDFYGNKNDTLEQPLTIQELKEFGNLILLVESLKKDTNYILEVLDPDGKIIETYNFEQQTDSREEIKYLEVGKYSIRLIEDLNKNGKWDPGNYDLKKQAERVYSKSISDLRANWDVEVKVRGTDLELETPVKSAEQQQEEDREKEKSGKTSGKRKN